MSSFTEQDLSEALKKGDQAAFRELVETWKDMVYNTVLGIVQHEADAEDVAQEVFVQVYQSIGSFRGDAKLSTWLYRIAVTKSLDFVKKRNRKKRWGLVSSLFGDRQEAIADAAPDFHHPGVQMENKERAAVLFKALDQLPERQKAVFVLHKLEGLPAKEIGEVMDMSMATVEGLMHRAKANLRKLLEKYYSEEGK
ncbi:RNA polymerase sigma factor [Chitinophaga agrisoli]|uniref:RNA polymerase sigma factor n=1 Tax=Chitinophaga agrisoli TaxID=2607653 RepID=A0A5B2VZG0_9BACT|nr:RNA polymerase sigma factor [Chitinophaga agrisoli]KAA2243419.1 RNA polymerase sigma factor [Chitinophaga agrisoli]